MTTRKRSLSEYVIVDASAARADRLWRRVRERLDQPRASRWIVLRPALVVIALLIAFGAGRFLVRQPPLSWTQLETQDGTTQVAFRDGSRLTLARNTTLGVREQGEQRLELALELGRIECDVAPNRARTFSVTAAEYEVRVTGTRFSVDLSRERRLLAVAVQSGTVEVRRAMQPAPEATLRAGDHWSVSLETNDPSPPRLQANGDAERPRSVSSPSSTAAPEAERRATAAEQGDAGSLAPVETREELRSTSRAERNRARAAPSDQRARALFDRGNAARRQGDLRRAARTYEQLLREHPGDARAGLAALELGRLRMDEFQDPRAAIAALELAARSVSDPGLRADVLARLVRSFESVKDEDRCREARADYLEQYPTGAQVLAVARACGVQ